MCSVHVYKCVSLRVYCQAELGSVELREREPFPRSYERDGRCHAYIHDRENANLRSVFKWLMNTKCVSKSGFLERNRYRVTDAEASLWTSEYPNQKRRRDLVPSESSASCPKGLVRGRPPGEIKGSRRYSGVLWSNGQRQPLRKSASFSLSPASCPSGGDRSSSWNGPQWV